MGRLTFHTAAAMAALAAAAPAAQRITSLPGLDTQPSFQMYSGYLTVNSPGGRNNFYWLVESQQNPASAPLVIWYTGGPGCSGLYALLTEHGPFAVDQTNFSKLVPNPYSWNAAANMLYIEQPSGVGFSYASDGNYTTGDTQAAEDNRALIAAFLAQYPEYTNRPAYLAGESYAGHYVPQLAMLLYDQPVPGFALTGFMVGNPSFDGVLDSQHYWDFMCSHGLCSLQTYDAAFTACNGTFYGPLPAECAAILQAIRQQLVYINPYNIEGACNGPPSTDGSCFTQHATLATVAHIQSTHGEGAARQYMGVHSMGQTVVPCMNVSGAVAYLNLPAVQAALHVNPKTSPGPWDVCSVYVNYTQYAPSVKQIYLALKDKMDILVYSGDVDSCVPQPGTQACMDSLGFTRHGSDWERWFITDANGYQQIAGYQRVWDAPSTDPTSRLFAYATVRDAGHMVPTFKPVEALALFQRYLAKQF